MAALRKNQTTTGISSPKECCLIPLEYYTCTYNTIAMTVFEHYCFYVLHIGYLLLKITSNTYAFSFVQRTTLNKQLQVGHN